MDPWLVFIVVTLTGMVVAFVIIGLLYTFNVGPYGVDYVPLDPRTGEIPSQPWTTPAFDYSPYQVSEPSPYVRAIYGPFEHLWCQTHPESPCTSDGWTIPERLANVRKIQYPNPNSP